MSFYDDEHIPTLLVQSKVDLLSDEEKENMEQLNNFSEQNGFIGCFKTSAKTGENVSESMEFLIKDIIKRLEAINSKGGENYNKDRQSVALDPDKHNKEADAKRMKDGGGCC